MRIALGLIVLICVAVMGYGARLVHQEQQRVLTYSAQAPATVLEKRLDTHRRSGHTTRLYSWEPTVEFRFSCNGREFIGHDLFPYPLHVGGNVGHLAAKAPLEKYEVGKQAVCYYNPADPTQSCLIPRPSLLAYLAVLVPVLPLSIALGVFWRSSIPGDAHFKRRKSLWIAVIWQSVGAISAAHYLYGAGANYAGGAVVLFGIYGQMGLVPLAFALPSPKTHVNSRRLDAGIWGSLVGTFVGFWMGVVIGQIALWATGSPTIYFRCIAYGMAIPAVLLFLMGLAGGSKAAPEREGSTRRRSRRQKRDENAAVRGHESSAAGRSSG